MMKKDEDGRDQKRQQRMVGRNADVCSKNIKRAEGTNCLKGIDPSFVTLSLSLTLSLSFSLSLLMGRY